MKIKLAILEKDSSYLNRIVTAFNAKYADKLEIYSFTDEEVAISVLKTSRIDVLLANELFDIHVKELPKRCGFAYFVDSQDIESVRGQLAICKFQRADLIYKQILGIYSENADTISGIHTDDNCKLVTFVSANGGTGSSTIAAAAAIHYAAAGNKVLYLNLERFGSADIFFSGEGQADMSDIVFALKSKKANLALKLESSVKQDRRGVYFFSESKIALDIIELTMEEIKHLISELQLMGSYDYIIVDTEFSIDQAHLDLYKKMNAIVMVGDGSEISNSKLHRAYVSLKTLEQSMDAPITNRMFTIYNKFSNKTGSVLDSIELANLGGAPRYEHATVQQMLAQLSAMSMFDKIL